MTTDHVFFLSAANLRRADLAQVGGGALGSWIGQGGAASLTPTIPCVTSVAQASMWTGAGPVRHGVIGNGFFHRDRSVPEVEFWVGRNGVVGGSQIWDELRARGVSTAVWHAQNIKDAAADFIVTPEPIHEPDGTTKLWCYSKPDGLYAEMLSDLGHFPLMNYWGPMSGIGSTRWILDAARWLHERRRPRVQWIYIPHLDYAAQKFGPDSPQAKAALGEFGAELDRFVESIGASSPLERVVFIVAGEYAITPVSGVVYPNRLLREAGLLSVRMDGGRELLDLSRSAAFAMVDHQFAHVFVKDRDPGTIDRAAEILRSQKGMDAVYAGDERRDVGLHHPRSGDAVAVCRSDHWMAYYWWLDDAVAPPFARTVDIHRKPGYDPVELFFDPVSRGIPLDAGLVRGSHGAQCLSAEQQAGLVCSRAGVIKDGVEYRDADMKRVLLEVLVN